jgi:nicotinamidase-related amidase
MKAILLVDIQNDYFPGGSMEVQGSVASSLAAQRLLTSFRQQNLPVVHIQHVNVRKGATFFLPGTHGVEFHQNVKPLPDEVVVQKNYPNSFRGTELLEHLQGKSISHVVLCGMMTHMCIDATARAAFDNGFKCTVISDACAAIPLTFGETTVSAESVHAAFLGALNAAYATVVTAHEFFSTDLK